MPVLFLLHLGYLPPQGMANSRTFRRHNTNLDVLEPMLRGSHMRNPSHTTEGGRSHGPTYDLPSRCGLLLISSEQILRLEEAIF